MLYYRNY